jgi:hypothetical protein
VTPAPGQQGDASTPLAWSAREAATLLGITVLALVLRLWQLGQPTDLVFDEVYFVEQGRNYLIGKDFMDPHPPIAKLTIGLGIRLLGDTPTGWRVMNAVMGTALVVLMYLLARTLFRRRVAATTAGLLVALDGLCLVDSRIAVIDIHYVTWAVAAYSRPRRGPEAGLRERLAHAGHRGAHRVVGRRQALHPVLQLPPGDRHPRDRGMAARAAPRQSSGRVPLAADLDRRLDGVRPSIA